LEFEVWSGHFGLPTAQEPVPSEAEGPNPPTLFPKSAS